jgi:hypothetical protein
MLKMESSIPADLLDLKTRLDHWRANRKYLRQPMPAELRQAAIAICKLYPGALVRRLLNLDPWRLTRSAAKKQASSTTRNKQPTTFFQLPTDAILSAPMPAAPLSADCRLQIERPDGARLTLTLPALDLVSFNRLAADFLRGDKQ